MITIDNAQLAQIVQQCFIYASTVGMNPTAAMAFLAVGKRLRGALVNLISAQFDAGTQQVLTANQDIARVNQLLTDQAAALANTAETLNTVNDLVGVLDGLLEIGAKFI